jgi:DNA repair protein RadD
MSLRDYQQQAVDAVIASTGNAIVEIATGGGKTHVIRALAEHYTAAGLSVLILAHRKELLEQAGNVFGDTPFSYYSASIGERCTANNIVIAGIQSIFRTETKPFDVIIVDEVHRVSDSYKTLFAKHPNAKLIGLSATPFKTQSGALDFGDIVHRVTYQQLLDLGYLVPIKNKVPNLPNLEGIKVKLGEYILADVEETMLEHSLLESSIRGIIGYGANYSSILIFCVSVKHATILQAALRDNNIEAAVVTGETPQDERDATIAAYKAGEIKHLIGVDVFLEGFDAPNTNMIVCLRPTKSRGLWTQLVGRGTRLYAGKDHCLLLDYGGNLIEHGALGTPYNPPKRGEKKQPAGRICPMCETYVRVLDQHCADCGFQFPPPEQTRVSHNINPDMASSTIYSENQRHKVLSTTYKAFIFKNGTVGIKVSYIVEGAKDVVEFLHPNNPRAAFRVTKFMKEGGHRIYSEPHEYSIDDLVWHCQQRLPTKEIMVNYSGKYPEILKKWMGTHETHGISNTESTSLLDNNGISRYDSNDYF